MGLLTAGLILWIIKTTRSRLAKGGTKLKAPVFGSSYQDEYDGSAIAEIKDHPRMRNRPQDTQWAEGLRGLASVGVVSSHICLAFFQQLVTPTTGGPNGAPMLFQQPIFRLVVQGQSFVALFFILMGFVNSLRPLKQAHNAQYEEALLSLAKSALNRSARLVLPAATMTCLAWAACQLHLNEIARKADAYWLYHTSMDVIPDFVMSLKMLRDALIACWVWGDNPYDQPQWALKWLFIGSFWIFCVLLTTMTTRPLFRLCVLAAACWYSWESADWTLGTNIYFGMFLAQLHTLLSSSGKPCYLKRDNLTTRIVPFCTAFLGLYLMSYPSAFAQDAAWSRHLTAIAEQIAPSEGEIARFWASLGGQILCLSIYFSPVMQRLLSSRIPCYLGGVSFSMYLLHGPLMRSVLATIVFGPTALRREYTIGADGFLRYPMPPKWTLLFTLPLFGIILMACVHLWAKRVEPVFARITKALEDFATGKYSRDRISSPLQQPVKKTDM